MEEYRMISQFDTKEIGRLYRVFKGLCAGHSNGGGRALSREAFMEIPCIKVNPLRDRICAGEFGLAPSLIASLPPSLPPSLPLSAYLLTHLLTC